jgi:hypothetical protein
LSCDAAGILACRNARNALSGENTALPEQFLWLKN